VAFTKAVDRWLAAVFDEAARGSAEGVCLVAVGGHGRGLLSPWSDLDLVLLFAKPRRETDALAQAIWYPIWDEGFRLDHSVRDVRKALEVAASDVRVLLGLLDARLLAGDPGPAEQLRSQVQRLFVAKAKRFVPEIWRSVTERHAAEGELAFLLEPNLKEARGGLRDLYLLNALALLGASGEGALAQSRLEWAEDVLLTARVELQRRASHPADKLYLQEQDPVAEGAGYRDADALMAAVAEAGRAVAWASDHAWRRVLSKIAGPKGRVAGGPTLVAPGVVVADEEVSLAADADPEADLALAWRLAEASARLGVPISLKALSVLADHSPPLVSRWPQEAREALVGLLGAGEPAVAAWEALDQVGLIVQMIPEWQAVRNRHQRNAYHRFTVDRHLIETAARAARLVRRVARPDLLLVGSLLHDIGKGFQGDHSEVGGEIARRIGARMGFGPDDVEVLGRMVELHLLLADVATRRDLEDPATVEIVAKAVGNRLCLDLLACLTEADGLATGPAAWGAWKAQLVDELVHRVGELLSGNLSQPQEGLEERYRDLLESGGRHFRVEGDRVILAMPDRPGMLATAAGVLSLHRLDVRQASAYSSEEGMAVEEFQVAEPLGRSVDWARVEADMWAAFSGAVALDALVAERSRPRGRNRPLAARPPEPRVIVDTQASRRAVVVEVRAPDEVGVLYKIAKAISDAGLDIVWARITSIGHEVVDAFYVQDARGAKPLEPETLALLENTIMERLSSSL
jgi:[protein-PII] uridylyltransferase